eukprot:6893860-Prymnesium_polylepis.1
MSDCSRELQNLDGSVSLCASVPKQNACVSRERELSPASQQKDPPSLSLVFCLLCVYPVRVDVLASVVSCVHVSSEHRVSCCQLSACVQQPVGSQSAAAFVFRQMSRLKLHIFSYISSPTTGRCVRSDVGGARSARS